MTPYSRFSIRMICATALIAITAGPSWGAAITATWTPGVTGNWNDGGSWTFGTPPATATFPSNGGGDSFNVLVDNGGAGNSTVSLNTNVTIDSLGVSGGDTVNFVNSFDMTVTSGAITNNGAINVTSTGTATDLTLQGAAAINGTGTITLGNNGSNRILGTLGNSITQGSGHTIQGAGSVLIGTGGFVNQGTIVANQSTPLNISPGVEGFDNTSGILRAENGGTLNLQSGTYANTGGTIEANGTGSGVALSSGVTIVGGDLATTGTGEIRSNVIGNSLVLDGVTVTTGSNFVQNNNFDAVIRNGVANNGNWVLNSVGASTDINFNGSQTLSGTGEIVMSDNGGNRIVTGGATVTTDVVTVGADQTIRGAGQILANQGGLVNDGTIRQQGSTVLTIDPGSADAGGGANFVNNGTLRAEGVGGIALNSGIYQNNTTIEALDGSEIRLNAGVTVRGGDLATTGTGAIRSTVNGTSVVLDAVAITAGSNFVQINSTDVTIAGGIVNNGNWELNSLGSSTDIAFSGSQTLSGTGEIVMSDNGGNRIVTGGATVSTDVITVGAGQTIRGAGQILAGQGGLVNDGAIRQQGSTALTIDPGSADAGGGAGFINNGTLRAEGGGGITLNGGIYQNNATIEALDGSEIRLVNGTTIRGGNLSTTGSGASRGVIRSTINGPGIVLDGVEITSGSNLVQTNSTDVSIANGIVNNGNWELNSVGGATDILFDGSQTVSGTGEIVMSDSGSNRILTSGATIATGVITLGSGQTIRGAGSLLAGQGGFVNNGTIDATGSVSLAVDGGTPGFINNTGTLRASGTGGIDIDATGDQFTQAGGLVDVQTGSRIDITAGNYTQTGGQTTVNGIMATVGTGSTVELQGGRFGGSGTVDFNGIGSHAFNNVAGTLAVGNSPGHLTITDGDYVQQATGSFEFELFGAVAGVSHDLLTILNGDAALAGSLDIVADQLFASTLSIGDLFEVIQLDSAGLFVGGDFFDTLTVNLTGLSFIQFFASNSLGGTSLFLEVTQADVEPPTLTVDAPEGLAMVLAGLGAMGFLRRRTIR